MFGVEPRLPHALHAARSSGNHVIFCFAWHEFDPCGVAFDLVEAHLIFVAAAGGLGELACLIGEQGVFDVVDFYDEVLLF